MSDIVENAELLAFVKAVEAKSLTKAAAELRAPRATLGRRLARLEQRLALRLIRRTTRNFVLTDAGSTFYRHAHIVLDALHQATSAMRDPREGLRGDLRLALPPFVSSDFNDLLCDFAESHPMVRLHVHVSTEIVDLRRDGYDVAIRATPELEPGLVARTLSRVLFIAAASPGYLAERGMPKSIKDLRAHRSIVGYLGGTVPQLHWPVGQKGKIRVEGTFFANSLPLRCEAAVRGLGIGMFPKPIVDELLASGALVQVLPGVLEAEGRLSVVYAERQFLAPHVRAFVNAVIAWVPKSLPKLSSRATAPSQRRRRVASQRR